MKKKQLHLLALALAAVMLIAACGGSGQSNATTAQTTAAQTTAAAATTKAAETKAAEETTAAAKAEETTKAAETKAAATTAAATTAAATQAQQTEAANDLVTFTLYMGDINNTHFFQPNTTPVWQEIMKLTGVDLDIEFIVGQDERQKAGLMIAAGEYPDLMIPHDARQQFIDADALLPINDLIEEHGQTILAVYGNYIKRMYKQEYGGRIYSWTPFGMGRETSQPGSGFYICADALEARGWPVIRDVDEYFDAVIDFTQNTPTMNNQKTIGFSGPAEGWRFGFFMLGADKLNGMHNTGGMYFDPDNNWYPTPRDTMEHRKDYLKRMFHLNKLGILDQELLSQTYDQYVAKIASGSVVAMFDEWWEISSGTQNLKNNPDLMGAYPVPMPIKYDHVKNDSFMGLSVVGTTEGVCITRACKDPVRAMQFFDRMAQDDVLRLINWGIEGEHYIVKNGRLDLTDEQWLARQQADFPEKTGVGMGFAWDFPHYMEDWGDFRDGMGPYGVAYCDKSIEKQFTPEQHNILNNLGWKTFCDPFGPNFLSPFGFGWDINIPPDRDDLAEINAALDEVQTTSYYQKMILAKDEAEFTQLWNDLVEKHSKVDRTAQIEYFNETVQRRIAEWN